jgi:hypothetical protein
MKYNWLMKAGLYAKHVHLVIIIGVNTPYVCICCMFRPFAAIFRYIELLLSPFYLLHLLTLASALYRYVVHVIPLCYPYLRTKTYRLDPNEEVLPEDRDRIQSPKRCVLKNKQDNVLDKDKTKSNIQKRNILTIIEYSFRNF